MPLRFTLRQLEYFVAVGEAGSVALAAKRVNISSPSISAAIAQLEDEFGVALFARRHAKALSLTASGRQLMAEARRVIAAAEGLDAMATDLGGHVSGPLALGCLTTFAPLVLPDLRRRFEGAFPAARLSQYELDHAAILDRLSRGALDLGLSYDLSVPAEMDFAPLTSLAPWVMLSPGHPLAGRPELRPEDLAQEPMVLLDLPHSSDYFLSLFDGIGMRPRVSERTRDMALLRSLVANGFGFSLTNTRTEVATAPDGKPLVFLRLSGGLKPLRLGLIALRGAFQRSLLSAFRDHCLTVIAAGGLPGCLPAEG